MKNLVFGDTETTGLHPGNHHIWEVALVKREEGDPDRESRLWLQIDVDIHMGDADPFALNIGKFWERYGTSGDWGAVEITVDGAPIAEPLPQYGERCSPIEAARYIRKFTHDCILIGNTIAFDAERMGNLLRDNWQTPTWHYQPIDIEPLIVGYLHALNKFQGGAFDISLPYNTKLLSEAIGVPEPEDALRHTAMGDALWVMYQWDALGL